MVAADLHVHTTNSDGTLELAEVPAAARRAGLDAVAVTDHDRLHPGIDRPVAERDGVTLVHGIELRVESDAGRVDLLGYGARPTDALTETVERVQRDRVERGRAIIDAVEAHLGHEIPVEPERGIGRPDIARAVVASAPSYDDLGSVFDDLIGEDGPCYVRRRIPSFERAREVLGEACAVVGLAHPLRYPDPESALALTADLDAVEVHYPYDGSRGHTAATGPLDIEDVAAVADEHDLLVTGGSDAHERDLGETALSADEYERFAAALDR
ncbi:PHP domain-containing protein [Halobacteriales archaeon QH_7_68_42]|nr:MAG: PHP domain-containing protein [Halobacteriales archaeon QH_7_68_42]